MMVQVMLQHVKQLQLVKSILFLNRLVLSLGILIQVVMIGMEIEFVES